MPGVANDLENALRELIRGVVREEVQRVIAEVRNGAELLTMAGAAEVASVSPATVRRWIRDGRLPAAGAGRLTRVRRGDLEKMLGEPRWRDPRDRELTPEELADRDFGDWSVARRSHRPRRL